MSRADAPIATVQHELARGKRARLARLKPEIYFVADVNGYIKIGRAVDVYVRVAIIQNAHAQPVKLLATMPGGRDEEKALHERFRDARVRGEWFRATPELLALITSIGGTKP